MCDSLGRQSQVGVKMPQCKLPVLSTRLWYEQCLIRRGFTSLSDSPTTTEVTSAERSGEIEKWNATFYPTGAQLCSARL